MRLAVEEINLSAELLPHHTLGYTIFDSCGYPLTGQRAALALLNDLGQEDSSVCSGGPSLLAVIGESGSALSIVLSRILQLFKIPMVMTIKKYSFVMKTKFNLMILTIPVDIVSIRPTDFHSFKTL